MGTAMGIDVSLSRGQDVVILDSCGRVVHGPVNVATGYVRQLIADTQPDVVAIDAPPAWSTSGRSRPIERQLAKLGISIFATPSDPAGRPFFDWMEEGFKVFAAAAAAAGYPLYRGGPPMGRQSLEVYPWASAVAILRCLPPRGKNRIEFRRRALRHEGVSCEAFSRQDQIDAALAALTGLRFLDSAFCHVGVPGEAVLVMPGVLAPERYLPGNVKHPSSLLTGCGVRLETRKGTQGVR